MTIETDLKRFECDRCRAFWEHGQMLKTPKRYRKREFDATHTGADLSDQDLCSTCRADLGLSAPQETN